MRPENSVHTPPLLTFISPKLSLSINGLFPSSSSSFHCMEYLSVHVPWTRAWGRDGKTQVWAEEALRDAILMSRDGQNETIPPSKEGVEPLFPL